MCDQQKQCTAPVNGKRCPKLAIDGNKFHCVDHIEKGILLYNKYKQICNKVDEYDITKINNFKTIPEKIKYLHRYYSLCISAYKGRMAHRDYAFIPDLRDYGHELQFEIILEKSSSVEAKLTDLYDEWMNSLVEIPEVKQENSEMNIVMEKVKKFKKKRINDVKLTDNAINKYIRENKKITDEKYRLIDRCITLMRMFSPGEELEYDRLFGFYHLIYKLYQIAYFTSDFKPQKCNCHCKESMNYRVNINCVCKNNYDNMKDFLYECSSETLKSFHGAMDQNRKKIENISGDYNKLWKDYGISATRTPLSLVWNGSHNRLVLKTDESIQLEKMEKKHRDANRVSHKNNDCVTQSILRKWIYQGVFNKFKGDNYYSVSDYQFIRLKDAVKNLDYWKTDVDLFFSDEEKKTLRDPEWRKGLIFN